MFEPTGAREVLRPRDEAEERWIAETARFLGENFGFAPRSSIRALRDFRDLLDRPELVAALQREPALSFGRTLVARTGYEFAAGDAAALVAAAEGPPAEALADPLVAALLGRLRGAGLLAADAGDDFLALYAERAAALRALAARPDGAARVEALAAAIPFEFSPSDAAAFLAEPPPTFGAEAGAFLAELLHGLEMRARAAHLPELSALAGRPAEVRGLRDAARRAGVRLAGKGALLVLARLLAESPAPLDERQADRLADLAGRLAWPDHSDFLFLVPLARTAGAEEVVETLADRHGYRFAARDGPALAALAARGVPEVAPPAWIAEDRRPLIRPDALLGPRPAEAFADENDLAFMEALAAVRPELAAERPDRLARAIQRRLRGRPVRYRIAAGYTETAHDLSGFSRADLLKIRLLLDELSREEFQARIAGILAADLADPTTEHGGWFVLGEGGRLEIEVHAPMESAGNDRLALPIRTGAALEFHVHATDDDDSGFAGPSAGGPGTDLFRAAHHRVDGVVFTRLSGSRFDCDLYTSAEKVLDLGVFGPPTTEKGR